MQKEKRDQLIVNKSYKKSNELINAMGGGALKNFSILALGVSPYISASIIIQLLTVAIPSLERLSKQGEEGRKKINV